MMKTTYYSGLGIYIPQSELNETAPQPAYPSHQQNEMQNRTIYFPTWDLDFYIPEPNFLPPIFCSREEYLHWWEQYYGSHYPVANVPYEFTRQQGICLMYDGFTWKQLSWETARLMKYTIVDDGNHLHAFYTEHDAMEFYHQLE